MADRTPLRSRAVTVGTLGVLAATFLAGCGSDSDDRYCADRVDSIRVDDDRCRDTTGRYGWYYVSSSTKKKTKIGAKIAGGSYTAKGGFGSTSKSKSGGS